MACFCRNLRKIITKRSGKCWRLYSELQVKMEWVTAYLHVQCRPNPVAYSSRGWQWSRDFSQSVRHCLLVYRDTSRRTTADISCLIDITRSFFDGKDIWWCLSQDIAGILHESHANYQVIINYQHDYSQWSDSQNTDFAVFELIKPTNLDIKDAAFLHVVHFLQYPTSRPTTSSTQDTMVNAPKKNLSPLPAGKYGQSTQHSTRWCHQANKGKNSLEAERVRALGALRHLWSNKKFAAEKQREIHFLSNEEREKWIEDYVERETAVARQPVQDAETAIIQEQEHMGNVGTGRSTTTQPEISFEEMLNAIGDYLSDFASS